MTAIKYKGWSLQYPWFIVLLFWFSQPVYANTLGAKLEVVSWLKMGEDRLAGKSISGLAVNPITGTLWVGSNKGLSAFRDGRFKHFSRKPVLSLAVTSNGVAAGTSKGMVWVPESFDLSAKTELRIPEELVVSSVFLQNKRLWVYTTKRNDFTGKLFSFPIQNGIPIWDRKFKNHLLPGRVDGILPAGSDLFYTFDRQLQWHKKRINGEFTKKLEKLQLPIHTTLVTKFGTVIVQGSKVKFKGNDGKTVEIIKDITDSSAVLGIRPDKNRFWVASTGVAIEYNLPGGKENRRIKLPDQLHPTAITEDFLGRLWVGSGNGLMVADLNLDVSIVVSPIKKDTSNIELSKKKGSSNSINPEGVVFDESGNLIAWGDNLTWYVSPSGKVQNVPFSLNQLITRAWSGTPPIFRHGDNFSSIRNNEVNELVWNISPLVDIELLSLEKLEKDDELLLKLMEHKPTMKRLMENFDEMDLIDLEVSDNLLQKLSDHFDLGYLRQVISASSTAFWPKTNTLIAFDINNADQNLEPSLKLYQNPRNEKENLLEFPLFPHSGGFSWVVHNPLSEGYLAKPDNGQELLAYTTELTSKIVDLLPDDDIVPANVVAPSEQLVVFNTSNIFVKKGENDWKTILNTSEQEEGKVLGLLNDPYSGGLLIGCWGCGKNNLFHSNEAGNLTPIPFPKDKVGAGNNALMFDSQGRLWVSSKDELFVRSNVNEKFEAVVDQQSNPIKFHANALLENNGNIWVASGDGRGIWVVEQKEEQWIGHKIVLSENSGVTLSKQFNQKTGKWVIWGGGQDSLLVMIDPKTRRYKSFDSELDELFPGKSGITVDGLVEDGDGMLILTDEGLVRVADVNDPILELVQGTEEVHASIRKAKSNDRYMFKFDDGKFIILSGESLWLRKERGMPFELIATIPNSNVAIEGKNNEILIGTDSGLVIAIFLDGKKKLVSSLLGEQPLTSIQTVCQIGNDRILMSDTGGNNWVYVNKGWKIQKSFPLSYWNECLYVNEKLFLVSHDGITLIDFSIDAAESRQFTNPIKSPILAADYLDEDKTLWLATKDGIIPFNLETLTFDKNKKHYLPNPIAKATSDPLSLDLKFVVSKFGFWLGSHQHGLWRLPTGFAKDKRPGWSRYTERDGLSGSQISAIFLNKKGNPVVFSDGGPTRGTLNHDTELWIFKKPRIENGIFGTEVRMAEIIDQKHDGNKLLIVATDNGITLFTLKKGSNRLFSVELSSDDGLISDKIETFWVGKAGHAHELWVGGESGFSVFRLSEGNEKPQFLRKITIENGLPPGKVKQIRVSEDGNDAWILVGQGNWHQLVRWYRGASTDASRMINVEPFLFSSVSEITVGPSVKNKPPRIAIRDAVGQLAIWNLGSYLLPTARFEHTLTSHNPKVQIDSLDPGNSKWISECANKSSNPNYQPCETVMRNDLFSFRELEDEYLVRLVDSQSDRQYVIGDTLEPLHQNTRNITYVTLFIIGVIVIGIIVLLVYIYIARRNKQDVINKRRQARDIPYEVGGAITGDGFYGRQELLEGLRDSIASKSQALIGEFRIGKTSIQHQLTKLLRESNNDKLVYLPVFLTMHRLNGGDDQFFRFLGRGLLRLAREWNVKKEVLADLNIQAVERDSDYDVYAFQDDLQSLIDYWSKQFAPNKEPLIVLQIDEIGIFKDLNIATLRQFRSIFVDHRQIKTVLTGTFVPQEDVDVTSEWWNFFTRREITKMTPDEARRLIVEPAVDLFTFNNDAVEDIMVEGQYKPFVLQQLCAHLLEWKYQQTPPDWTITLDDFRNSIETRGGNES